MLLLGLTTKESFARWAVFTCLMRAFPPHYTNTYSNMVLGSTVKPLLSAETWHVGHRRTLAALFTATRMVSWNEIQSLRISRQGGEDQSHTLRRPQFLCQVKGSHSSLRLQGHRWLLCQWDLLLQVADFIAGGGRARPLCASWLARFADNEHIWMIPFLNPSRSWFVLPRFKAAGKSLQFPDTFKAWFLVWHSQSHKCFSFSVSFGPHPPPSPLVSSAPKQM